MNWSLFWHWASVYSLRRKTWEYPKEQRKRKKLDFAITKVNINFVCAFSLFWQSEQSAWKSFEKGLIFTSLILIMHLYKYILTQKYNGRPRYTKGMQIKNWDEGLTLFSLSPLYQTNFFFTATTQPFFWWWCRCRYCNAV